MKIMIKILICAMVAGAIGQYTSTMIRETIRLRRKISRREIAEMSVAANLNYGKLGVNTGLVV